MNPFSVRQPRDGRRVEAHSNSEACGKVLMVWITDDERRAIARLSAGGKAPLSDEVFAKFVRIDTSAIHIVRSLGLRAEHRRPLAVEIEKLLCDRAALLGIGFKKFRRREPAQDRCNLPAEIEAVLHRHIHALSGFWAVRVASVAGDKDTRRARRTLGSVGVIIAYSLANLVDRPPHAFLHFQGKGMKDPLGGRN